MARSNVISISFYHSSCSRPCYGYGTLRVVGKRAIAICDADGYRRLPVSVAFVGGYVPRSSASSDRVRVMGRDRIVRDSNRSIRTRCSNACSL